jgi:hypothetical protein
VRDRLIETFLQYVRLASLKITVTVLVMAVILVVVGTLAQVDQDVFQVVDDYFRAPLAWIDLKVFFPPSFFPGISIPNEVRLPSGWLIPLGFYFPGGWLIGALMMIIPLAMTLAHAYGLVDDPTGGRRASMIICGAYLVVMGNAMPRALPPVTSKPRLDALIQAFHRRAGWTWVLCGLAFLTASLALPIKTAGPVSMALVGAATVATIVQILRLAHQTRQHAPGLN